MLAKHIETWINVKNPTAISAKHNLLVLSLFETYFLIYWENWLQVDKTSSTYF